MPESTDLVPLWKAVERQFRLEPDSVHGPSHWKRVEDNGLRLAAQTGADVLVVRLFAVLHDSQRENEGTDREHGERAAAYAATLRGKSFTLDDARLALLVRACAGHHKGLLSDDPTVATCWDADRLDLGRVGIPPDPKRMSTAAGKALAG